MSCRMNIFLNEMIISSIHDYENDYQSFNKIKLFIFMYVFH